MPALGATGALVLAAGVLAWSWGAQGTPPSEPPSPPAGAPTAPSAAATPPPIAPATSTAVAPPESARPDTPSAPSAGTSQSAGRPSIAAQREPSRPRRPRSSAAPTGEPGELRVGLRARRGGSLPDDAWAQVRIDGRAVDGSPPMSLRLPPGRHVVEVRPYGQSPGISRTVEIEPGGREVAIFTIDTR